MKKHFLIKLSVYLCIFLLVGVGSWVRAQPAKVTVAYNPLPFNLPTVVERHQGYLAAQGLTVSYPTFLVGHAMSEAMLAGDLDVAPAMGGTSVIVARAGGRDLKIIGCYSQAPAAFGLAVLPDTLGLPELAGTTIAVPLGTEAHVLLAKILAEQGLTPKDVHLVNMMIPDGMAALQSGQVDAALVVDPVLSKLAAAGKIQIIRDGTGLISGCTLAVVPGDLVDSWQTQAFLQAHQQSLDYMSAHYDEALALAGELLDLPAGIVAQVAAKYDFSPEITDEIRQELDETIQFLFDQGLIRKRLSLHEVLAWP